MVTQHCKFALRCIEERIQVCDHWDELMHELTFWKFKTVSLGMVRDPWACP